MKSWPTQAEAQAAIQELNGTELGSRQIEVREDSKTGGASNNKAGNNKAAAAVAAVPAATTGAAEAATTAAAAVAPISTTS